MNKCCDNDRLGKNLAKCVTDLFVFVERVPPLSESYVRKVCTGVNQINLSNLYIDHMDFHNREWILRASVKDIDNYYYLVQIPMMKSRMEADKNQTSYFLFDKKELVDSMCTCNKMARSVPCAHRGTALIVLHRKQKKLSLKPKLTRSIKQRSSIKRLQPDFHGGGWKDQQERVI